MTLYITEKPSQVQALDLALKANKIEDYKIVSLAGHLLSLFDFKDYGVEGKWNELIELKQVPFFPKNFEKKVKPDSKFMRNGKEVTYSYRDKIDEIKPILISANKIILATDPDNEGVVLALEILEKFNVAKNICGMINMSKLDLSSLKREVLITNRIGWINMFEAGEARAEYDWTFGMNTTIAATVKFGNGNLLNLGGVKLPTLRMVVDRDKEFEIFKEIPYFTILAKARFEEGVFLVKIQAGDERFSSENLAKDLLNKLRKNDFKMSVIEFTEVAKTTAPGKPYSLTDLQSVANKRYKLTASQTLELAQKLYQDIKIQSYPRTDSNYYAEGEFELAQDTLKALSSIDSFKSVIDSIDMGNLVKRKIFDDSKIEAHTALSPLASITAEAFLKLGDVERKIFLLVAERYIIQFMQDYKYLEIKGKASDDEILITFGENLALEKGFKSFANDGEYEEEESETAQRTIPSLQKGDIIEILEDSIEIKQGFTKPRPRFKEASLLQAMEKVHRFFEDKEVKEHLGDGGIGTPATRAKILEELKTAKSGDTPYLELNQKGELVSTEKARFLMSILPDEVTSPLMRAKMERQLKEIIKGENTKKRYIEEVNEFVTHVCELIASSEAKGLEPKVREKQSVNSSDVVETTKTFRLGDKFIFKSFRDKTITKAQAKKILEGGKVKLKLKSKAGKDYEMDVFLRDGKLEGEFA
jgi:DNA topoisomerase-3